MLNNTVVVSYTEYATSREVDSDGDWSEEDVDFTITGVSLDKKSHGLWETVPVDFAPVLGQDVWVVVVRYSTGSTFGTSRGNGKILGVYSTSKEADEQEKLVYSGNHPDKHVWTGYFNGLDGVDIQWCQIERCDILSIRAHTIQ